VIGISRFFTERWRRQVPLGLLFWWDMLVVGTLVNLAAAFAGLMALGFKAELPVAMVIFLAPLPYSIFLVAAIWRTADVVAPARAQTARLGAALWLAAAMVF
jgi:hypothetical protein